MKKLFISLFAALFALTSFATFASPVKVPANVVYSDDAKKDEAKEEQKADDDKKESTEEKKD